jgi:hypothetical protein
MSRHHIIIDTDEQMTLGDWLICGLVGVGVAAMAWVVAVLVMSIL